LAKVESASSKLQASHAPLCKFWTVFAVINGIRHVVPVIHGPSGCTYSAAADYKMYACEYRGVPFEPDDLHPPG
jgi:nitrogenase molybdenum-iron protein alpha/beta subunit